MAKAQMPIDGKLGKTWKVSSLMGWRIHPVLKTKKHHNGTDVFGTSATTYIEAFYDGKVLHAGPSKVKKENGEPGGFGYYVVVQHKIDGKFYTSLYAHLKKGSIKVKAGQKIEAGTVLGVMGTTGMSTGVHLHWEIWIGKTHGWTSNGKGFVEPIAFTKALIAKEAVLVAGRASTPDTDDVAPAPAHDEAQAAVVAKEYQAAKVAAKAAPTPPPVIKVPTIKPDLDGELKKGSKGEEVAYLQKSLKVTGDTVGVFGPKTHAAVALLQRRTKLLSDGIVGPLTWGHIK